jgi:hypothetical protein
MIQPFFFESDGVGAMRIWIGGLFFLIWERLNFCVVGVAVLQGFLRILWCNVVVIRGEFVVDCVANVVVKTPVFEARKIRQGFELYFAIVARSAMKGRLSVRFQPSRL